MACFPNPKSGPMGSGFGRPGSREGLVILLGLKSAARGGKPRLSEGLEGGSKQKTSVSTGFADELSGLKR